MIRSIATCLFLAALVAGTTAASAQEEGAHHGGHQGHGKHGAHGAHGGDGTEYTHHTMQHDFSKAEEWSERFDAPERKEWQRPAEVAALMAIEPGMTVVDLGAGTGYFMSYLAQAAGESGRVLALDPEPDMVRFMGERAEREGLANVEPRKIPFDDPELAPGSVDRMLIVNTWHHILERDAYAGKLFAALKPGGAVYIVDFTKDSPSGPPVEERLEPDVVVAELAAGGLEASLVDETLPRQYVVAGRRAE